MSLVSLARPCPVVKMCTVSTLAMEGVVSPHHTPAVTLAVWSSWGRMSVGGMARYAACVGVASHVTLQGVVIGVGEQSEFGTVFKMMRNEEVWRCLMQRGSTINRVKMAT